MNEIIILDNIYNYIGILDNIHHDGYDYKNEVKLALHYLDKDRFFPQPPIIDNYDYDSDIGYESRPLTKEEKKRNRYVAIIESYYRESLKDLILPIIYYDYAKREKCNISYRFSIEIPNSVGDFVYNIISLQILNRPVVYYSVSCSKKYGNYNVKGTKLRKNGSPIPYSQQLYGNKIHIDLALNLSILTNYSYNTVIKSKEETEDNLTFSQALALIYEDKAVSRKPWDYFILKIYLNKESPTLNRVAKSDLSKILGSYHPSNEDMFANDWCIYKKGGTNEN